MFEHFSIHIEKTDKKHFYDQQVSHQHFSMSCSGEEKDNWIRECTVKYPQSTAPKKIYEIYNFQLHRLAYFQYINFMVLI